MTMGEHHKHTAVSVTDPKMQQTIVCAPSPMGVGGIAINRLSALILVVSRDKTVVGHQACGW